MIAPLRATLHTFRGVALRTSVATNPRAGSTLKALGAHSYSLVTGDNTISCRASPLAADTSSFKRRWLSSSGGQKGDDSDDDFKPQRKAVSSNPDDVTSLIQKQVNDNPVMLYMKGTPSEPRCGFSAQVVRILHAQGVSFSSVNVLDYMSIREGIKAFSEWPTIPQLFVKGEFVGGCDILTQMNESGELATLFKDSGLKA